MTTIEHLPTEILSLIAEHIEGYKDVYTCTLINSQFYAAANPVLWRTIDIPNDASLLTVTTCLFLSRLPLGRHIRKIDLHVRLTNTTFLLLMTQIDLLDELNIRDGQLITDASFQYLPERYPKLKSLLLCDASITSYSMYCLAQSCRQLRKLNLDCCMRLSPDTFSTLIDCPLEELAVAGNDPSDSYGKHWLTVDQTTMDLTHFHSLTHLTIADWSTPFFASILTTNIPTGGAPWPCLTHLYLQEANDIGDDHLIPFIKSHPRLKNIYLSYGNVTDASLNAISAFLPGITDVSFTSNPDITAQGVRQLVQNCPLLQYVDIEGCSISFRDFPDANGLLDGAGHLNKLLHPAIIRMRLAWDSLDNDERSIGLLD